MPDAPVAGEGAMAPRVPAQGRAPAGNRLLMHMCCGPCACICIRRLQAEGWNVTGYYMNPNIQPLAEYLRRREAAGQCAEAFGVPMVYGDEAWDIAEWLRQVQGRDAAPERCRWCVSSRMEGAFAKARELGCTHFFSSLLYSKYQPHEAIREAGERLSGKDGGPLFLYRDFRPDWQAGIDLSIEMGLYRQPYCGCVYSEAERYAKKLRRLVQQAKGQ